MSHPADPAPVPDHPTFAPPDGPGDPLGAGQPPGDPRGVRPPARGRLGATLAWIVILAGMVVIIAGRDAGGPAAVPPSERAIPSDDPVAAALLTIQGRYAIGASRVMPAASSEQLLEQVRAAVPAAPPKVRMRMAILAAELVGPERGLDVLADLEAAVDAADAARPDGFALEPDDARIKQELTAHLRSLAAGEGGTIGPDDAGRLANELGWWGRLAAVLGAEPAARAPVLAGATRTAVVFGGGLAIVVVAGLVGVVLLVTGIVLAGSGRLRVAGSLPGPLTPLHPVLAETFAAWLVVFVALLLGGGLVAAVSTSPAAGLVSAIAAFFLSLVALAWPRLRGVAADDARAAMGLTAGRGLLREVGAGVVGYVATLPLLAVGVLGTLLLAVATGLAAGPTIDDPSQALLPATGPAHPIVGEIGRSATVTVLVLVAGAVAAPVVEEIFFRGCLHGHVRSGLRWLGSAAPLAAALVTAFVFAAIHPQGWIAVPALMSLAVGFSLVREWRGSVVAPIVMHAINNGAVLTGLSLMLA